MQNLVNQRDVISYAKQLPNVSNRVFISPTGIPIIEIRFDLYDHTYELYDFKDISRDSFKDGWLDYTYELNEVKRSYNFAKRRILRLIDGGIIKP